jgi:hypothetical protein
MIDQLIMPPLLVTVPSLAAETGLVVVFKLPVRIALLITVTPAELMVRAKGREPETVTLTAANAELKRQPNSISFCRILTVNPNIIPTATTSRRTSYKSKQSCTFYFPAWRLLYRTAEAYLELLPA